MQFGKTAVVDLGTNTFHLLIAKGTSKNFKIIYDEKIPVMIGRGGINKHFITKDAQERAFTTLFAFRKKIEHENITNVYVTATSAIRNAENGRDLVNKFKDIIGYDVNVISGQKEAELIYLGVNCALNIGEQNALIMDIGGGSVEFIICNCKQIIWKQSFEIGAQRMMDLYHKNDPIKQSEIDNIYSYLNKELQTLIKAMDINNPKTLIGSSGTFDTLSDIYKIKKGIVADLKSSELPLDLTGFMNIYSELLTKNREERLKIPGMIEMRVEMIVVASILIHFVISNHKFNNIRVSSYALKEGVLYKVLESLK